MANDTKVYTYIDPQPLLRAVLPWQWSYLAVSCLWALANVVAIMDYSRLTAPPPAPEGFSSDTVLALTATADVVIFVVAAVLSLKWTYRVSRNAHALAGALKISPPWAVGYYFVPFATLWIPFKAMSEIWRASEGVPGWRKAASPALLRWWWGVWLACNALSSLAMRLPLDTLAQRTTSAWVNAVTALATAGLVLIFVRILRVVTQMQVTLESFGRAPDARGRSA